ncbi:hypothetical protein INS49_012231 [Diaporthe citri]|uniref:uncharacterized protein n=1 Tax=Diaporthe citri TaxID=83186 RepID=UPI001C7EF2C5|nr:uncharacterized protein INS49_012231 [Diaporthe citri]KAG6358712.1 hypothetical protein INS49_012231 [Diaporthe citri]
MTTPFDDDATTASIESAHDDDIDISKAPIVVSWTGGDDQAQSLSHSSLTHDHVTFDVHFDAESHTAFFKITANLAFKGKRSRSNIFLFIHPERIRSLDFVEQDDESASTSKILGTSTYSLHFVLIEPPALVVPKDDYVPKGETARNTLQALQALSRVTRFRLDLPSNVLAKQRLLALCEKASSGESLKTLPGAANLAKLYGGKGGQVIQSGQPVTTEVRSGGEPSGSAERASQSAPPHGFPRQKDPAPSRPAAAEFPPSYDDLGHSPPVYPPPSNKRRRLDSPEDTSQSGLKIEEICRQGFSEIGRRLDHIEKQLGTLGSRLDRVEQRMSSVEGSSGQQSHQRSSEHSDQGGDGLDQRVGCVEERVTSLEGKLESGLSELAENVDTQVTELRYDFDTTTLIRIEDEMGVAQTQLEEFVRDELRNVAEEIDDTIREKLRDALS